MGTCSPVDPLLPHQERWQLIVLRNTGCRMCLGLRSSLGRNLAVHQEQVQTKSVPRCGSFLSLAGSESA